LALRAHGAQGSAAAAAKRFVALLLDMGLCVLTVWLAFRRCWHWLGEQYQGMLRRTLRPKVLIYGAGQSGRQLAAAMQHSPELQVAGFLDDDERLHGHVLNALPIYNPADLPLLARTLPSKRLAEMVLQALAAHSSATGTGTKLNALLHDHPRSGATGAASRGHGQRGAMCSRSAVTGRGLGAPGAGGRGQGGCMISNVRRVAAHFEAPGAFGTTCGPACEQIVFG